MNHEVYFREDIARMLLSILSSGLSAHGFASSLAEEGEEGLMEAYRMGFLDALRGIALAAGVFDIICQQITPSLKGRELEHWYG